MRSRAGYPRGEPRTKAPSEATKAISGDLREDGMTERTQRCMVCAKEKTFTGTICEECKAMIRGEATEKGKKIRKEAEREIRREGVPPKK